MLIKEVLSPGKLKEGYNLAAFSGSANIQGDDNFVSPVGSVPKSQQLNTKKVTNGNKKRSKSN